MTITLKSVFVVVIKNYIKKVISNLWAHVTFFSREALRIEILVWGGNRIAHG